MKSWYRKDIDGLRAIAVIFVLLSHFFSSESLLSVGGGYIGVDIFFVISGFLITGILLRRMDENRFSFITFYAKRVRRIFPAMIFVAIIGLIAIYCLTTPAQYEDNLKHLRRAVTFLINIRLADGIGYFDAGIMENAFMHFWSLAVEEQYYLLFPVFLWGLFRFGKKSTVHQRIKIGLWGAVLVSFTSSIYLVTQGETDKAYFLPQSRFWEIGVGALLAYYARYQTKNTILQYIQKNATVFASSALLALGIGLFTYGSISSTYPSYWGLLPTIAAATLIITGLNSNQWTYRFLSHPIMVWIGLISYPLYLWHWLFISFPHQVYGWENTTLLYKFLFLFLSFILAVFTFYCIERPLRTAKPSQKTLGIGLLILLCIFGCTKFLSQKHWIHLWGTPKEKQFLSLLNIKNTIFPEHKDPKPQFIVLGNSHAMVLHTGIKSVNTQNIPYSEFYLDGLLPILNTSTLANQKIQEVLNLPVKHIFIRAFWFEPLNKTYHNKQLKDLIIQTLDTFRIKNKHVTIIITNPIFPYKIDSLLQLRLLLNKSFLYPSHISIEDYRKQNQEILEIFHSYQKKYPDFLDIINKENVWCDFQYCQIFDENHLPLLYDNNHLNYLGAQKLMKAIWSDILLILNK